MKETSIINSAQQAAPAAVSNKAMLQPELIESGYYKEHLQPLPIQRKLSIVDTIIRMPEQNFVQRKCAHCEEEKKLQRKPLASFIQRKETLSGTVAPDVISNKINASKGNGNSMDGNTHSFMQSRFGADFSDVKIHTGSESVQLNRELNAKAFTVGNDIYFNEGQYSPGSGEGKHLLAHELTHTLQQNSFIQRQAQPQAISPGTHPEINIDPQSAEIIITQAVRALGNFRLRGQLTQPLNLITDVTGVSTGLPPSTLDLSIGYDDRCNRALQSFFAGVSQQQAAGQNVFDFSHADWSATVGAGLRFGGLRVDASGTASFNGDQFQAFSLALTFARGVSQAIPAECRHRPSTGDHQDDGHHSEGGGGGNINVCAGIDCTSPATVRNFILHRLCCLRPPETTVTPATPELTNRTIYFFYDTTVFKQASNNTLTQVLDIMKTLSSVHLQITGHTSMEGTERHNQRLSQGRADAVKTYLTLNGIDASRIHLLAMGENMPAVAEPAEPAPHSLRLPQQEAIRDLNRRAETVFFDPTGTLNFLPASPPITLAVPDLSLRVPGTIGHSGSLFPSLHLTLGSDE